MPFAKCCSLLATTAFLLSLPLTSVMAAQAWPSPPSQLSLSTPYGELQVTPSDYIYEAQLQLNAQLIEPDIKGLINLPYAFKVGNSQTILVSVDTGLGLCPITYYWLTLDQAGHNLSSAFGSCSAKIRVSNQGSTLIVQTPSRQTHGHIDEYTYKGGKISRRQRPTAKLN